MSNLLKDTKTVVYVVMGGMAVLYSVVQYLEAKKRDVSDVLSSIGHFLLTIVCRRWMYPP